MRPVILPGSIPGLLLSPVTRKPLRCARSFDLVPAGDGMIVHLRLLPGLVDDYRALVERALAS